MKRTNAQNVTTVKIIHILFHKKAVCEKGTKREKKELLDEER